ASLDRPKLRPVSVRRYDHAGQAFALLEDPLGIVADPVLIPLDGFHWVVRHFDGRTTLAEIQARILQGTGQRVAPAELRRLVEQLDAAMILDGPTFAAFCAAYRQERIRPPAHAGRSYAGSAPALRAQLARFFADARGSGPPDAGAGGGTATGSLRGILSPHIDFDRGGPTYTWSYRALVERSDAQTFVILGVAHQYCAHRFALTRKDFQTPLGLARTESAYVDRVAAWAGEHLFDDELAHRTEHSIEFQVVFLQYLLGDRRDVSIVPILVGSFHDLMEAGIDPIADPEVRRFVEALRRAEAASGRTVAYIGGIDLGHVGREFGDPDLLDPATLAGLRAFDATMLGHAAAGDPAAWFATAAAVDNRWRVCGLAATYTMLHAIGPAQGRLLKYDQAVNPERTCCVSFASLAFHGPESEAAPADVPSRATA
ncbi:MAG TPA: AmmeMemoRadiSam system protein B, partial [Isosphaeraceae bacterium]